MTTTATKSELVVTPQVVEAANAALAWLEDNVDEDVGEVFGSTLSDAEAGVHRDKVNLILQELDRSAPIGAFAGGTGTIKDNIDPPVSGEVAQNAIKLMKEGRRIHQCGRGRGKCIVLLNTTPFEDPTGQDDPQEAKKAPEVETTTEKTAEAKEWDDVTTEPSTDDTAQADKSVEPVAMVEKMLHEIGVAFRELTAQNATLNEQIRSLQEQLDVRDSNLVSTNETLRRRQELIENLTAQRDDLQQQLKKAKSSLVALQKKQNQMSW